MEQFIQASAMALLAVVLALSLGKEGKDMSALLSMAACCMIVIIAVRYLQPVVDFLHRLEMLGDLNGTMTGTLFKVVGIGMISEVTGLVCSDAGNASLGKALQMLGAAVILWMSIPIFNALIDLIQKILGEV